MAQQNSNQQQNQEQLERQAPKGAPAEKRFVVKQEAQVARGGSCYTLPKGKVISSHGYDIAALKKSGVQLEEVGG